MKYNKNAIIEAIGGLKMLLHDFEKKSTQRVPFKAMRNALATAIECCEKQIPKKVEDFMERTEKFGGFYKLDFMCPSCEKATICQPYRPNYCKHCGQKLDWGDE